MAQLEGRPIDNMCVTRMRTAKEIVIFQSSNNNETRNASSNAPHHHHHHHLFVVVAFLGRIVRGVAQWQQRLDANRTNASQRTGAGYYVRVHRMCAPALRGRDVRHDTASVLKNFVTFCN